MKHFPGFPVGYETFRHLIYGVRNIFKNIMICGGMKHFKECYDLWGYKTFQKMLWFVGYKTYSKNILKIGGTKHDFESFFFVVSWGVWNISVCLWRYYKYKVFLHISRPDFPQYLLWYRLANQLRKFYQWSQCPETSYSMTNWMQVFSWMASYLRKNVINIACIDF